MRLGWKRGLPPGKATKAKLRSYEVYFSPGGFIWHRRRTEREKKIYDGLQNLSKLRHSDAIVSLPVSNKDTVLRLMDEVLESEFAKPYMTKEQNHA